MAFLEHKLNLKVQQKQVLTPSLVQMVNLLALNKLELTDMIQQELVQNPVLEEGTEIIEGPEAAPENVELAPVRNGIETPPAPVERDESENSYIELSDREKTVDEGVDAKAPEPEPDGDPYGEIDFQSFDNYLNDSASRPRETEIFEKPSFENFIAKTPTLTDHLEWQLGLTYVEEPVRLACHSIIGNLNEDGYLYAVDESNRETPITLEEIAETGGHALEEVEKALEVVQAFDPPGVAARDLRECLMLQLHVLGEDDCYSMDIVRDPGSTVQGNCKGHGLAARGDHGGDRDR
jgi:RNA polymerase sigma-54 factor